MYQPDRPATKMRRWNGRHLLLIWADEGQFTGLVAMLAKRAVAQIRDLVRLFQLARRWGFSDPVRSTPMWCAACCAILAPFWSCALKATSAGYPGRWALQQLLAAPSAAAACRRFCHG
jgi:hypothetical protein